MIATSILLAVMAVLVMAVQGQTMVTSTCVTDIAEAYTYAPNGWPDLSTTSRWIWNAPDGEALGNSTGAGNIVYFFAVYNAAAAGTAKMYFTADNWAELSVNDVVIATAVDLALIYSATFPLKLGTNVI
jgi:hypothetical protein